LASLVTVGFDSARGLDIQLGRSALADITVTKARIGCLDIQHEGTLTGMVAAACNNHMTCSFKAPTEDQYRHAGVHAATRTFCTQAMEITYVCADGRSKTAFVPGDAWNNPPAQLACDPPAPTSHPGHVHVRTARIGCLDIQTAPNLTSMVERACNDRAACQFKAPTEAAYRAAGVSAQTRQFCTQAMEIKYDCGDSNVKTAFVRGDAWDQPPAELVCLPPVTPATYRQHWGYDFINSTEFQTMVGGYDLGGLQDVYGKCKVDIDVAGFCEIPDPLVGVYLGILDASLQSGQCFGFSLSSLRFRNGDKSLVDFPRDGNDIDVWHLRGSGFTSGNNVSPTLSRYIHYQHVLQMSIEAIGRFVNNALANHTAALLQQEVTGNLAQGSVLSMASNGEGHAVVPYNITPLPNNEYGIDVYDPNVPYSTDESNAATHTTRMTQSRLIVHANNTYDFHDNNGVSFSGGLDQITIFPYSLFRDPHPPVGTGLLSLVVGVVFGGAAHVTQIADNQGHTLLLPNGQMNRDPRTRLPGSAVLPSYGGRVAPGTLAFALDANGSYTHTVDNRANGKYSLQMVGGNFAVQLANVESKAGAKDTLNFVPGSRSFEFNTDAPSKAFAVTLHSRNVDKTVNSAKIEGTATKNARLSFAFNPAGDTLTYRHQDAPVRLQFRLTHTDQTKKTELVMDPVDVKPGDEVTLKPNWKSLNVAGGGELNHKDARGATTVRKLKP
jgi:hypothetical protein